MCFLLFHDSFNYGPRGVLWLQVLPPPPQDPPRGFLWLQVLHPLPGPPPPPEVFSGCRFTPPPRTLQRFSLVAGFTPPPRTPPPEVFSGCRFTPPPRTLQRFSLVAGFTPPPRTLQGATTAHSTSLQFLIMAKLGIKSFAHTSVILFWCNLFSSAVPSGSGAFQMPTRPSSSSSSAASTLRGGRANLRNASVTFSLFLHEASLGWH